MDAALGSLVGEGMMGLLLDLVCLLAQLRSLGASVVSKWEELVLSCLASLVAASGTARDRLSVKLKDKDRTGLQVGDSLEFSSLEGIWGGGG